MKKTKRKMKTTKKILLVVLMLGTLIGYANDNNTADVILNAKKVKVEFRAVKKGHTFTIKDSRGTRLYKQTVTSSGNFSKLFDLTALENGSYTAELDKDFEVIIKPFIVDNGLVTFLGNKKEKIFKPVIVNKKDLVLISKIEFNNKPLNVTIYHENEMIYNEKVSGDNYLNRVYSLAKSPRGSYKIIINSDNRTYTKDFIL